ncbi:MAG: DUF2399 domain-containing protein [Chloroflexi bacterium]|nr:DUF2399 domain-containing protein [Chloroflexota bacterium]
MLNTLLDTYERRRLPSPKGGEGLGSVLSEVEGVRGGVRLIKCALRELPLPNYFSQIDPDPRKIANDQLLSLEQRGWLDLTWQSGETGHLLAGVAMHPEYALNIFNLLERTPLSEKRTQLADLIRGELFRFQDGWRGRAIDHILRQLKAGKSAVPFSLTDRLFNQDLLIALSGLDAISVETPYRVFSVRLFNNSKRFEELKNALVRLARLGHREWRELSSQDVLRELSLVPNPDYIYLSGPWQLVDDLGQAISLSEFSPSVGIPAAQASRLQRVTAHASQIICVENPTSFHEFIRATQSFDQAQDKHDIRNTGLSIAALCLWGNPSPACRHLLSRLAETLPENIHLKVWADLDYGGFNILAMLRKYVSPHFEPYLMDVETLETHSLWAHPLTQRDEQNLKRLSHNPALVDVKPVINHMLERNLKLEQEAIGIQASAV